MTLGKSDLNLTSGGQGASAHSPSRRKVFAGRREGLKEEREKVGDHGRVGVHRPVRRAGREGGRGGAGNDKTAAAKTKDQ